MLSWNETKLEDIKVQVGRRRFSCEGIGNEVAIDGNKENQRRSEWIQYLGNYLCNFEWDGMVLLCCCFKQNGRNYWFVWQQHRTARRTIDGDDDFKAAAGHDSDTISYTQPNF